MSLTGRRYLYSTEYLGIENFKRERLETAERFGISKGKCIECDGNCPKKSCHIVISSNGAVRSISALEVNNPQNLS